MHVFVLVIYAILAALLLLVQLALSSPGNHGGPYLYMSVCLPYLSSLPHCYC